MKEEEGARHFATQGMKGNVNVAFEGF